MQLETWEILVIRQCKNVNPNARIVKRILARRFGLSLSEMRVSQCGKIMVELTEKITEESFSKLIIKFNPEDKEDYRTIKNLGESFFESVIFCCMAALRYSDVSNMQNYSAPIKIRKLMWSLSCF